MYRSLKFTLPPPNPFITIVLQGVLQLGSNPSSTSSKAWKSYLFVLKHDREAQISTLDYYRDVKKRWQKQEKRGSINLWPYFDLSLAHNCSYKFPLKITTTLGDRKEEYYLAAGSFDSMNKWCNSLQMTCYLVPSNRGEWKFDSSH